MSVMNGFREELLTRILGLNGHMTTYAFEDGFTDFDTLAGRIEAVDGIVTVSPIVTGQVIAAANGRATFGQVRGVREAHLEARPLLDGECGCGHAGRFRRRRRRRDRQPHGPQDRCRRRRFDHAALAGGPDHPDGVGAALARLSGGRRSSKSACSNTTTRSSSCRSTWPRSTSGKRARSPPSK